MSLELVIVFPVVLALIWGGVQAGVYYHARTIALAAAQEGARAAAVESATPGAGRETATAFVTAAGGDDVLPGAAVAVTAGPGTVTVTVTGNALNVLALPGLDLDLRVTQSASVPVERITP